MQKKILFVFIFVFAITSCFKRPKAPPIGNSIAHPGSMATIHHNSGFLMLNTNAASFYSDGSIHNYSVDVLGNSRLESVFSVESHGTEIALSEDDKLVALSFDTSKEKTEVQFIDYSTFTSPKNLSHLTISLNQSGGNQTVKQLGFFKVTGFDDYFLFGKISTFQKDDGIGNNVPDRVFVIQISRDFSSSKILFVLSYGLGDQNSLLQKSDSLTPAITGTQYTFGSSAPTYDKKNNLLIAFPTGSKSGYNVSASNTYPALPLNPLDYMSGKSDANSCDSTTVPNCIQPDMRTVSVFAVDMISLLRDHKSIDQSLYFVPLGWNGTGVPYSQATYNATVSNDPNNAGVSQSFAFQWGFGSSYWLNASNCYDNLVSTNVNNLLNVDENGANTVLFSKNGDVNVKDGGIYQITGFDVLRKNIDTINSLIPSSSQTPKDFKDILTRQMIDQYNICLPGHNSLGCNISSDWIVASSGVLNPGPLTPYIYSKTTGSPNIDSLATMVSSFNVIFNDDGNGHKKCVPVWTRNTYNGIGNYGMDSSWLGSDITPIIKGTNIVYPNLLNDPGSPSHFAFKWASGARICSQAGTSKIYCFNFLTGEQSHFNVTQNNPVFNPF